MKMKSDFEIVKVADDYMLIPVGEQVDCFNGTVILNEVSAFLLEKLQSDISKEELVHFVTDEFDVDLETAEKDVSRAVDALKEMGIIHE